MIMAETTQTLTQEGKMNEEIMKTAMFEKKITLPFRNQEWSQVRNQKSKRSIDKYAHK